MAEHADTPNGQLNPNAQDPPVGTGNETNGVETGTHVSATARDAGDGELVVESDDELDQSGADRANLRFGPLRLGIAIGLAVVVALGGLSGWLGYRAYQSRKTEQQDELFLQVARQGAVNLTTIDWEHPQADIQRILDSATGSFRDDFGARSEPFIDAVTKLQSKSVGTVTDAGLESTSGDQAQVMVAMTVKTSIVNAPEQQPRSWRMRISVQRIGDGEAKVSNVAFVP